jgi:hypothetical protein
MMQPVCKICGETDTSKFYFRKDTGKYRTECKTCWNNRVLKYQNENQEWISQYKKQWSEDNKEEISQRQKERYQENREERIASAKKYQGAHKKKKSEYDKQYRKDNAIKLNTYLKQYRKNRRQSDPGFKLRDYVSRSINVFLKAHGHSKNKKSIVNYIPYSIQELKQHIEKQFEPWMTWDNHGRYKPETWDDNDTTTWKWNIDHIVPHSTFNYTSMEDQAFKECWALSNLRPLSAKRNIIEGTTRARHIISQIS